MGFLYMLLMLCVPVIAAVFLAAVILYYSLRFIFKLAHVPNYTSHSPSKPFSWLNLAPPDIMFRLASLAALNLVLYWLPIYYWTTYTPCGDDRDGMVLFPSMLLCPISWVLGALCCARAWRVRRTISPHYRAAFYFAASLFLLIILSTVIPQVEFYVRLARFPR